MRVTSALPLATIALSLLLSLAASQAREERLTRVKRVINGQRMDDSEFPWLVSIKGKFWKKFFGFIPIPMTEVCGASLISDRWVMSAAHCFMNNLRKPKKWIAYLASKRRTPGLKDWLRHIAGKILRRKEWFMWRMKVEKIIVHPRFVYNTDANQGQLHYDIALMKLKKPIPLVGHRKIRPVQLPTAAMAAAGWPTRGTNCTFAGWGCTQKGGKPVKFATKVHFRIVDDSRCLTTYSDKYVNLQNDMCAGEFDGNKGICPGDSGGPLVCFKDGRPYQAGIASATAQNKPENFPGIFTRLSTFRSWVLQTIRDN